MRINEQVVLVTGGARGLGVEIIRAFSREGALVVVDGPTDVKQAIDLWGPVAAIDLMRRVKDQFDPQHRLSPGRFVGGI